MANVHVIIGEDDFLVGETAKKVIGDGVGLEVIDSMNSSNADLQLKDIREADASFSTRTRSRFSRCGTGGRTATIRRRGRRSS